MGKKLKIALIAAIAAFIAALTGLKVDTAAIDGLCQKAGICAAEEAAK